MKNLLTNLKVQSLVLFIFILQTFSASAQQTLTQVNGWNAYVHLPASYNSSSQSYPTIIFFPGLGEVGTTASKLIANGPGGYIAQGWNGNVQVDGSTVEFIVISLQPPNAYPNEYWLNVQLQKLKSLYRIDNNKLYLTGLSHGGWCSSTFVTGDPMGGPFIYANQIAAVVTVQGVIPDDNSPYPNLFDNYASVGGKLLSFEQRLDGRGGQNVVNRMNAYKANSAYFIETNFGGGGHCCWSEFYGGGGTQPGVFNIGGVNQNLYQWLARQRLGGGTTPPTPPAANQPPTANAGADKTITLPTNTVSLAGNGTDADGTISAFSWTKVSGPAGGNISSATSATTNITALQQGVYNFRLTVKDNNGASATDDVAVTVNAVANQAPKANAGVDKTITLPTNTVSLVGSGTDADGTISSYSWTKVSGPVGGNISSPTSATTNITALQQGAYNFRLTVKDNNGASAYDDVTITVNAAANHAPKANAGADKTITLPTNTVSLAGSGTDADGTISSYNWTKVSGPAGGNISSATSATTNITVLQQGVYNFRLTVKDNSGASATDDATVTVNAAAGNGTGGGNPSCNNAAPVKHYLTNTSAQGEIYRPNGSNWKGGDTVVITGTNYSVIEFYNIHGDACRPIVIMPQTVLTTPAFRITGNSKYLKVWGGLTQYGIKIANGGLSITTSSYIEANNMEIFGGNLGIYCKQNPYYDEPETWGNSTNAMSNIKLRNLYIHDVNGEGMYLGHTSPSGFSVRKPDGSDTLIVPIKLDSVEVSNCIIERTQWDGIQLSHARGGNKIFNNVVRDYGMLNLGSQQAGIILGGNTTGDVYNNTVISGTGNGIQAFGYGVINIYNNVLDSCGYDGTALGQQTIYASDYITSSENNPKQTMNIYGNFIKEPMKKGAIFITNYANNSYASKVFENKLCIKNSPANWASIYLSLLVPGTVSYNNILSCDPSTTVTPPAPPANLPPVVRVENNKSITLPINTTTLNVVQATDADGTIVSYLWSKLSGPAAGNILTPTQKQTTVQNLVEGVYNYIITVTDDKAAKASDTLQITVIAAVVIPSSGKSLNVNIYGGSNGIPGTQWNNWNLNASASTGNLKYEDGIVSSIKAAITGDIRIVDNGANYATTSTAVDPKVLRYNAIATSYRILTLTGLKPGGVYDFEFFASRASNGNATVYQIQNKLDTINTDYNIDDVAQFENIVADASGKLEVIISRLNIWNYIAGFIITEKDLASQQKSSPALTQNISYGEDIIEATNSKVTVFPNPFVNEFKVQVDDKANGNYAIILTDISGKRSFYKEVKKASNLLLVNVPVANLPSGVYILQILNMETGKQTVHKVIKN